LLTKVETAHWQKFIRDKVGAALTSRSAAALAIVAFLAVFREGAETALFYQAIFLRGPNVILPVVLGFAVGSVILVAVWIAFHRFGVKLPLRGFFATTSALLYTLAFVFLGKGVRELQEGNVFSITPIGGGPYFEPLGIFPSVETLAAQGLLVALALFAAWRTFGGAKAPVATPTPTPAVAPLAPAAEPEAEALH
jgi:high-affinity iron transporter